MSQSAGVLSFRAGAVQRDFLRAVHQSTVGEPFRLASICEIARMIQVPEAEAMELAEALHQKQAVLRVRLSSRPDGFRVTMTRQGLQAVQLEKANDERLRA